ncbi:MAG: RNA 2',3'-cyclic phosphodiesterase [Candidatus Koribacter versatilis]|nr:RNA 2',3'-cyclic phosphodiesterase [Candidatus Koribacter versatilis]
MRVFVGIDLDPEIRAKIARFLDGVRGFAPDARWIRPESLHVTLKFIGEQKPEGVEAIKEHLRKLESASTDIRFTGRGFFPTTKAARVFWIGIQAGPELAELAGRVDAAVAELGVPCEDRPYSPHLTLARGGDGSGSPKWRKGDRLNSTFAALQKRLDAMTDLDFGTMTAREFFLYQSQLSPKGSKYTKLERFPLKSLE